MSGPRLPGETSERRATQTRWQAGLDEAKRVMIREAVAEADGCITSAARALGLSPQLLFYYIRVLGLRVELSGRAGERAVAAR